MRWVGPVEEATGEEGLRRHPAKLPLLSQVTCIYVINALRGEQQHLWLWSAGLPPAFVVDWAFLFLLSVHAR